MTTLPTYSPYSRDVVGKWIATVETVCNDGEVRKIVVELYADGYHAFTQKDGSRYADHTDHKGYKTMQKAINAGAKF